VKYKVLIKKCTDPGRADAIADEIARWSGTTADVVRGVITQKPVCIRKEADESEALRLKQQFEAIGAEIELVALEKALLPQRTMTKWMKTPKTTFDPCPTASTPWS